MYNQASIQKILDRDTKRLVTVLEIVTMARRLLTDLRRIFICSRKTLIAHHCTLLDIRKMLKIIHKVSDIPSVVMEALKSTRDSLHQIWRLLFSMRATKRFINKIIA